MVWELFVLFALMALLIYEYYSVDIYATCFMKIQFQHGREYGTVSIHGRVLASLHHRRLASLLTLAPRPSACSLTPRFRTLLLAASLLLARLHYMACFSIASLISALMQFDTSWWPCIVKKKKKMKCSHNHSNTCVQHIF